MDGVLDGTGYAESLTWSQCPSVAGRGRGLRRCGTTGDRAAILAPQASHIRAFLGALQAGFIAVPLSVPQFGVHDLRVASAQDSAPVALLTPSSVVTDVNRVRVASRPRDLR
jgi:long chain fatty acid CoA FadD26